MDPFEARAHFGKQLATLTASKLAAQNLAKFLIHYASIQDDLFPAVLETIMKVDLNTRISILQFLEELIMMVIADPSRFPVGSPAYRYVELIVKALPKLLAEVIPQKPKAGCDERELQKIRCLTNLPASYSIMVEISKVLKFPALSEYTDKYGTALLTQNDVRNIKNDIQFDDSSLYKFVPDEMDDAEKNENAVYPLLHPEEIFIKPLTQAWNFIIGKKRQSQYERIMIDTCSSHLESSNVEHRDYNAPGTKSIPNSPSQSSSPTHSPLLLTQRQMLRRIEADRERQKKGKEFLWHVKRPDNKIHKPEFRHIWNSLGQFDPKGDRLLMDELNALYNVCKGGKSKQHPFPSKAHSLNGHMRGHPPQRRGRAGFAFKKR